MLSAVNKSSKPTAETTGGVRREEKERRRGRGEEKEENGTTGRRAGCPWQRSIIVRKEQQTTIATANIST
jgi:hypothetical protein